MYFSKYFTVTIIIQQIVRIKYIENKFFLWSLKHLISLVDMTILKKETVRNSFP